MSDKKFDEVLVTVQGLGLAVNYEAEIIHRALLAEGIEVELVNDYPCTTPPGGGFESADAMLEHRNKHRKNSVKLVVEHRVWGG